MVKPALLDGNVLIALFETDHIHHQVAHEWLREQQRVFAACPITVNGYLRIVTRSVRLGRPLTIPDMANRLQFFSQTVKWEFWPEDISLLDPSRFNLTKIAGSRQISDVYLLGIAVARGGILATLDRSVTWGAVVGAKASDIEFVGG